MISEVVLLLLQFVNKKEFENTVKALDLIFSCLKLGLVIQKKNSFFFDYVARDYDAKIS